jgi:hypothetical protein
MHYERRQNQIKATNQMKLMDCYYRVSNSRVQNQLEFRGFKEIAVFCELTNLT